MVIAAPEDATGPAERAEPTSDGEIALLVKLVRDCRDYSTGFE